MNNIICCKWKRFKFAIKLWFEARPRIPVWTY